MVACLASPRLIVASHRSSSRLWGLRTVDDQVEVSVRYPGRLEIPGVIVHRIRDLTEHDYTYVEGIPVTTPARTLCDAGLVFGDKEVQRMINHALAKKIVTSRDLWRFRVRVGRQGRTGVGALERALNRLPPDISRADSGPEIEMRQLCQEFGVPAPIWQHPVIARGVAYRIDFAYPEKRIAVEYDEFDPHTTPEAFVQDRRRQNDLQECGWTVIRFTWDDLRDDPAGVARRLDRIRKSVNGSSRNS
jgi:restriction endonuclease-like protein